MIYMILYVSKFLNIYVHGIIAVLLASYFNVVSESSQLSVFKSCV